MTEVLTATVVERPSPPKTLTVLKCHNPNNTISNEQVFYIVGTAHVSAASCEEVRQVIRSIKPEVVVVELCPERRNILHVETLKVPTLSEVLAEWREGRANPFQAIYGWMLSRVAAHMEIMPGEEFRVACDEAARVKAKVVLGDRPLHVTLARVWHSLSYWQKVRLIVTLLFEGFKLPDKDELEAYLEELKESDAVTAAIAELGKHFPTLTQTLITERDQFMTFVMRQLSAKATRVVAVVGAGHLPGIRDCWESELDIQEIMRVPEKKKSSQWKSVAILGVCCTGLVATAAVIRWRRR